MTSSSFHGLHLVDRHLPAAVIPIKPVGWHDPNGCPFVEHQIGRNRVILGDRAMVEVYTSIRKLACSQITVLIIGETGCGKESAAEALHRWSRRADGPWVPVNCAALPDSLAESELFGYERGAFTDARVAKPGLLERAHGGTLFLDELGELSPAVQAKLLRAVESKRVARLGDTRERDVDVRIVAATNVDLFDRPGTNCFRQDLLYRLAAATLRIPALRDRPVEIELLTRRFVEVEALRLGRPRLGIADDVIAVLRRHTFPGNVRELKNAIEYATAIAEGPQILVHDLPPSMVQEPVSVVAPPAPQRTFRPIADELRELEKRRIVEALEAFAGVQTRAAEALSMPLRTFTFRMRQYGISNHGRRT